jgi:hypothetical protein
MYKLTSKDLHNLFSSSDIVRMIKLRKTMQKEHVACMKDINLHKILVGKSEGKRSLGRHKERQEYNIKINLMEIQCEGSIKQFI